MISSKKALDGLGSITPYFTVEEGDRLIDFAKTVFDAEVVKENRHADNSIQHVRLAIGDSIIMLNEATESLAANVSQMHLFVDDCDATYALALRSGATSTMEPNLRPHGDRMAGIKDPCGNIWWIATRQQPCC